MSKVVEKVVSRQLNEHLTDQGLLPRHQSAYRKCHSTETAMLRVMSDVLTVADQRRVTLIGLLDSSSAFDCASTIPCCCNEWNARSACQLGSKVLRCLTSYITGRSQQVPCCGDPVTHTVRPSAVRSSAEVCFRPSALRSVP